MNQSEKEEFLASLRDYTPPIGFSSRAAAKITVRNLRGGAGKLEQPDREKLTELDGLLAAAILGQLVNGDEMTLGMIKPRANEGIGLPDDDDEAARAIVAAIGVDIVPLQFHALLDETQTERFYGEETIARLSRIPSEVVGESVAKRYLRFITSDPVTMMLVSRPESGAVEWLKKIVGVTRPSQARPDSIRGRYAKDSMMPNNLMHRSDTPIDAMREIEAFRSIVGELLVLGGGR
ncbi:MAG: hypothetical protein UX10_C0028G0008 [Candidatus Magasanikbacteria bacterium GW2011_GWA2_45_39]|uniref:Nucleoside diphosphate kinase-like domain-containing protein n=1 Tax=Candidatus Magasanikbacteria bacterium GW2011_GWA2_45_39 TaxID=1619041 RepID=A0A0G1QD47_9BACT|nr:MAG: hypothetical protein UX10_C0028G0008 [Candidatus Magasanikbacteria bacterium GW2011_GWA2_45_39]